MKRIEINGIYYKLSANRAEVTSSQDKNNYSGIITIPSSIHYNRKKYSITNIGKEAFENCGNLIEVNIPDSVKSIGERAFCRCEKLTKVNIANSVTNIEKGAFYGCEKLTAIYIPQNVINIAAGAFGMCYSLTEIKVDADNQIYDSRDDCNAILEKATNTLITGCKDTTIPNSVTNIGDYAFAMNICLEKINIPNSVTNIGVGAFMFCNSLTKIDIPNSVRSIKERAFESCKNLTELIIPNSVMSIGDYAFMACTNLTEIEVKPGNVTYDSRNNSNAIIETKTNTLIAGCKNTKIPNTVTSIGDGAFSHFDNLSTINIPDSITHIGKEAFLFCCSLTEITIPGRIINIGDYAFNGCINLTKFICNAEIPPICKHKALDFIKESCVLFVPKGSIETYQKASQWNEFSIMEIIK